jgi:stress response protein SCP2
VEASKELVRYRLGNEFDGCTAVQVGSLIKENGVWSFHAVGNGSKGDLGGVIASYS